MRSLIIFPVLAVITLMGCVHEPIHQGNRLDNDKIYLVRKGDTRFNVEQALGTPVLNSALHPNRVTYYEEFEDKESGDMQKRGIEITYDDAFRVIDVRRFGFDKKEQ